MTSVGSAIVLPRTPSHPAAAATRPALNRFTPRWSLRLVLVGMLALGLGLATLENLPVGEGDDGMYLILAKSLATGQGYRSLNVPGAPRNTHFPPGYPAVLSVLWRVLPSFPQNVILFKAFNIACFVGAAVGIARFAIRERMGRTWSLGLGVLAAISVPSLVLVALIFSEPLFICLIVLLLPSAERFVRTRHEAHHSSKYGLAIGFAIGVCTLVRTHGLVLVPAIAVMLAAQRRWRDIAFTVCGFLVCFVPWQLWCARYSGMLPGPLLGEYDTYASWWIRGFSDMGLAMIPRTLARTSNEAMATMAALFSPARGAAPHAMTLVALAILLAAGVAVARRRIPVTLLFLAGYLTIVLVWPFQPSRFIWGVWPLLLMVLVLGCRGAMRPAWPVPIRVVVAVAAMWAVVGYASYETRAIRGRWWSSIPRAAAPHISFAVEWAKRRTLPAEVIATEDEGPVFLYTGRRTVPVRTLTTRQYLEDSTPEREAESGLLPIMAAYPVRSVVVHSLGAYSIAAHLSSVAPPRLAPRASTPGGAAFAVLAP